MADRMTHVHWYSHESVISTKVGAAAVFLEPPSGTPLLRYTDYVEIALLGVLFNNTTSYTGNHIHIERLMT